MKKIAALFCILWIITPILFAQNTEKAVNDAFLITRMAEKFHVQPRPLNDEMSSDIYVALLEDLDDGRIFFLQEDINKLSTYRYKIADEIRDRKSDFLQLLTSTFKQRLQEADTMTENICKKPFNFYIHEKLTVLEDSSYPASLNAMHNKIYKYLKLSVLKSLKDVIEADSISSPTRTKKIIDSLEPISRKKANNSIRRFVKKILQSPKGVEYMIGNIYCQVIASSYDPHSAYFPPDVKNAFESLLGNKPLVFGFSLEEDDDGKAEIGHLQPGSPAFASGQINEGDRIISITWENQQPIDVSDADVEELNEILSESGGDKLTINVKKVDGTTRQVTLRKAIVNTPDEEVDDNRVKGFVLKGSKSVGYISLPDFYSDWEDAAGTNGCANDVAKEILKLKKENISGLILDLRFNGGGSINEAVNLAGIFIDAGPVELIKSRDPKIATLKDVNRGTIFDGPLVLLVNGSSASASEMVAGTLQDYNRALIVGSRTYGKATGQLVLPMDTTVKLDSDDGKSDAASYVKLTTMKLFRVTGKTAQKIGVVPDIVLPDPLDALSGRESDDKKALDANPIDANKYYQPLPPIHFTEAAALVEKDINSSEYFINTMRYIQQAKIVKKKQDISLMLEDALKTVAKRNVPPDFDDFPEKNQIFTVTNHAFEQRRVDANKNRKEANDELKEKLQNDPYVQEGFKVVNALIK